MDTLQDRLIDAIWRENVAKVESLLAAGASANEPGSKGITPLVEAAETENGHIVRLLLDHGADVNRKGYNGYTPLHIAVDSAIDGTSQSGGRPGDEPVEVVELLLQAGADVTLGADNGETPLDWATNYGSKKMEMLLRRQAEP